MYFGSQGVKASKEDWDKSLGVNVVGCSNMVQACLPFMLAAGGECRSGQSIIEGELSYSYWQDLLSPYNWAKLP